MNLEFLYRAELASPISALLEIEMLSGICLFQRCFGFDGRCDDWEGRCLVLFLPTLNENDRSASPETSCKYSTTQNPTPKETSLSADLPIPNS